VATEIADYELRCVVVTPERAVLDEKANFVALPLYDGEIGILPGRAPLVGRVGYGELRLKRGKEVKRLYVDGGFVQVRANVVTVLTARALKPEELTVEKANAALQKAKEISSPEERLKAEDRARAQLRVLQHAATTV
jgi:F-type H+-transporting ATPase subunit epsilon